MRNLSLFLPGQNEKGEMLYIAFMFIDIDEFTVLSVLCKIDSWNWKLYFGIFS